MGYLCSLSILHEGAVSETRCRYTSQSTRNVIKFSELYLRCGVSVSQMVGVVNIILKSRVIEISTQVCRIFSLHSKEMFDGAEANLIAIMEQYPPVGLSYNNLPLKKRIFSQFLHLVGVWFLQKSPIKDVDQVLREFIRNSYVTSHHGVLTIYFSS